MGETYKAFINNKQVIHEGLLLEFETIMSIMRGRDGWKWGMHAN